MILKLSKTITQPDRYTDRLQSNKNKLVPALSDTPKCPMKDINGVSSLQNVGYCTGTRSLDGKEKSTLII